LAIAAQNCCVVAGYLTSIGGQRNFTVINLSEGDGTEIWRQVIDTGDTGRANAVAAFLDGTGDFVAGGTLTAIRLAAADGSELWRAAIDGNTTSAVAVDGAGDVVAAGGIVNDFAVIKLNGADGTDFIPS
jgi:outer membrane protein assembly factor BamB